MSNAFARRATPSVRARHLPTRALFSATVLVLIVAATVVGPWLVGGDPNRNNLDAIEVSPSAAHLFGTDQLGRDIFLRTLYGGRTLLAVCAVATLIGGLIGAALGLVAGYAKGIVDPLLSRLADMQLSIPQILLALIVLTLWPSGVVSLTVVLVLTIWPVFFRLARARALGLRTAPFVQAGRLLGASRRRLYARYLFPNALATLVVGATIEFTSSLTLVAGLSFIGVGLRPPDPSWGSMVAEGQAQLHDAWWLALFPALAIIVVVWAVHSIGDWFADRYSLGEEEVPR
jgi:peptide/nickel transport system permease protein